MGLFDLFSSTSRKRREAVVAVGLETGLFQKCPVCRDVTEKQAPEALVLETEFVAERWVTTGDARVAVFGGDIEALNKKIREVKRKAPFNCTCEDT